MKIAQIAPFWFDIPPEDYGGTERVISYVTEELVKRGHEVTLFAASGSKTGAKLVSPISSDLVKTIESYCDPNFNAINTYVCSEVFKKAHEFDIIHAHNSFFSFFFCDFVKTPVIHTLHNQLPRERESENELFRKFRHLNYVSISNQFRTHFDLNYIATVYHGLDLKLFPFQEKGGEDLFWIGRALKSKGELEALEVAKATGKKLTLALSVRKDCAEYFQTQIKPQINEKITVVENVKFEDTWQHYGKAKAFLFPVEWEEPFGLILIESMACGTPVIAFAKGSIPEIVKDGETGLIVNPADDDIRGNWIIKKSGLQGLVEAVKYIYALPEEKYLEMRKASRAHVEKNFTVEQMVDNYEKVYQEIL